MPASPQKNSRFSGKYRLNCVRFTCCSSASACAKSGLTVTSSVSDGVTPYLASRPICPELLNEAPPTERVESDATHGLRGRLPPWLASGNPVRLPARLERYKL